MTSYIHKNWCGQGDRLVVHPKGLPPEATGNPDIVRTPRAEEAAQAARELYGKPFKASKAHLDAAGGQARLPLRYHTNLVFHFHPETLVFIESFPCR